MRRTGLILARYQLNKNSQWASFAEQMQLLHDLKDAPPVAYRVADPTPDDKNNYIIAPRSGRHRDHDFISVIVCCDRKHRMVRKANRVKQEIEVTFEDTDDCDTAVVVMIPELQVLTAEDVSGEGHLPGMSAVARLGKMLESLGQDVDFNHMQAGSPQDLDRAMNSWKLERFSFQARPFNPHPSNPGEVLSELLKKDGVGSFRGVAVPKPGGHIEPADQGIVREAIGLANAGYAVYGAEGKTLSGAEASIKKPEFSDDRGRNLRRQSGPQQIRVHITPETEEGKVLQMVDVLIDFFGNDGG